MGQQWVKEAFSKIYLGPLGMLKHVFLAHFEPGCDAFWTKDASKVGPKSIFPKSYCRPFAVLKDVFSAHAKPLCDAFWPTENPKMP